MINTEILEQNTIEFDEKSKKIMKMKFCIISCYSHIKSKTDLLNFTLDYQY